MGIPRALALNHGHIHTTSQDKSVPPGQAAPWGLVPISAHPEQTFLRTQKDSTEGRALGNQSPITARSSLRPRLDCENNGWTAGHVLSELNQDRPGASTAQCFVPQEAKLPQLTRHVGGRAHVKGMVDSDSTGHPS